jgi:two-component system NarL family sensor kinase
MADNYLNINPLLFSIPIMLFILAFVLLLYNNYVRYVRTQQKLKHRYLSNLEEERKRISRDLHDTISVKSKIQKEIQISNIQKQDWIEQIINFERNITDLNELLFPTEITHGNLYSALERLSILLSNSGKQVTIYNQSKMDLPKANIIHIYRILQESIINVFKHTENNQVILSMYEEDRTLKAVLSYQSNSAKLDYENKLTRRGQQILNERLSIVKGTRILNWEEGIMFENFKFNKV